MRDRRYLPTEISNYEIAPCYGIFSFIVPEQGKNEFLNPSFETGTTTYSAGNATISRTIVQQRRGAFSCSVTISNTSVPHRIYCTKNLTAGKTYTFSADVYGVSGVTYELYVSTVGTLKRFTSNKQWRRPRITFRVPSTGNYDLTIRTYSNRAHTFYTDGWQLEESRYPTTYMDGDMSGFVPGQTAYYWLGSPHNSMSVREESTRSGGKEVFLHDLDFKLSGYTGLGMMPLNNVIKPLTKGGGFYNATIPQSRAFSLIGSIFGKSIKDLERKRRKIIDCIRFDKTSYAQEMIVRYRPDENELDADVWDIRCVYNSGLEGNITNEFQENISMQFIQSQSYIELDTTSAAYLGTPKYLGIRPIIVRDENWTLTTICDEAFGNVNAILFDRYNNIYAGGEFVTLDSVSYLYVAKWDGNAWNTLDTGLDYNIGDKVNAIVELPNGNIVIGGLFTIGTGTISNIALYDPVANTLSAYGDADDEVTSLVFANGKLYVAGVFNNIGGSAIDYLASTADGSTYTDETTGLTDMDLHISGRCFHLQTLTFGSSIHVYFMWQKNTAGNETVVISDKIVNASSPSWTTLYTSTGGTIYGNRFSASKYYGCLFLAEKVYSGTWAESIIKIKGTTSEVLYTADGETFMSIMASNDGPVHIGLNGNFEDPSIDNSNYDYPNGYIAYRDYKMLFQGDVVSIGFVGAFGQGTGHPSRIAFAMQSYYSTPTFSTLDVVENAGDAVTSPQIQINGFTQFYQMRFQTSRKFVHYKDLIVNHNEKVTQYFDKPKLSVISDYAGDVTGKIFFGNYNNIAFMRGDNSISMVFAKAYTLSGGTAWQHHLFGLTYENTDNGTLYIDVVTVIPGTSFLYRYYKDSGMTQLVAHSGTFIVGDPTTAWRRVLEDNSSGIAGVASRTDTVVDGSISVPIIIAVWKERRLSIGDL